MDTFERDELLREVTQMIHKEFLKPQSQAMAALAEALAKQLDSDRLAADIGHILEEKTTKGLLPRTAQAVLAESWARVCEQRDRDRAARKG